jgi:hypothetical protein
MDVKYSQTPAGKTEGNSQAGRRGSFTGNTHGAGPVYPASRFPSPGTSMGPDFFGVQLWVSSGPISA